MPIHLALRDADKWQRHIRQVLSEQYLCQHLLTLVVALFSSTEIASNVKMLNHLLGLSEKCHRPTVLSGLLVPCEIAFTIT